MIRQSEFKAYVESRSYGSAQANVSSDAILEFPVALPAIGIIDMFNCKCQTLFDHIIFNEHQSRTLSTLRDTLLPKLVSGEVRV
jgi:type I restriction enzyme S subunit